MELKHPQPFWVKNCEVRSNRGFSQQGAFNSPAGIFVAMAASKSGIKAGDMVEVIKGSHAGHVGQVVMQTSNGWTELRTGNSGDDWNGWNATIKVRSGDDWLKLLDPHCPTGSSDARSRSMRDLPSTDPCSHAGAFHVVRCRGLEHEVEASSDMSDGEFEAELQDVQQRIRTLRIIANKKSERAKQFQLAVGRLLPQ